MAKAKTTHQPFEGRNPRGQFTKITQDMMDSAAWKELSLRQRGLYLQFKSKYRQKTERGNVTEHNRDEITLPESEWKQEYGNYRTFRKDIDILVRLGFIRLVQRGQNTRTPNLYGFSVEWQKWRPTMTATK